MGSFIPLPYPEQPFHSKNFYKHYYKSRCGSDNYLRHLAKLIVKQKFDFFNLREYFGKNAISEKRGEGEMPHAPQSGFGDFPR